MTKDRIRRVLALALALMIGMAAPAALYAESELPAPKTNMEAADQNPAVEACTQIPDRNPAPETDTQILDENSAPDPTKEINLTDSEETDLWMTEDQFRRMSGFYGPDQLSASTSTGQNVSGTAVTGLYKSQFSGLALAIYEALEANPPTADNNQVYFTYPLNGVAPETAKNEFRAIWSTVMFGYLRDHQSTMAWNDNTVGVRGFGANEIYLYGTLNYAVSEYYTASLASQVTAKINSVVAGCTGSSRYERLRYYHDWLVENNSYDQNIVSQEQMYYSHSQVGCLVKGKGVCESYTKAFKVFCQRENIPCLIVTSPSHAFNYVKMEDGRWYMIDCTWDDPIGGTQVYRYYMLVSNDPAVTDSHVVDSSLLYPVTSSTAYKPGNTTVPSEPTGGSTSNLTTTVGSTATGTGESETVPEEPKELPAPVLGTLSNTTTGVKVTWTAIPGTSGLKYRVYRKTPGGSWKKVGDTKSTSYTDTSAAGGTTYYYTVRAMDPTDGSFVSTYNKSGKKILYLVSCKPTLTNASGGVTLKWTKAAGAAGYYIYRKSGSSGYSRIATVTSGKTVSYTDTKVKDKNGTAYTYAVKAYSGSTVGSYTGVSTYRVTGVSISSLSNTSGRKLVVKWAKNTKGSGYQIQYSTSSSMSGAKTVTVSGASSYTKTITSLTKGKYYYVRVRAYKKNSKGTKYYSAWSSVKKLKITK